MSDPKREQILRDEIAERNTRIEDEEKYALADGELLEKMDNVDTVTTVLAEATDALDENSSSSSSSSTTTKSALSTGLTYTIDRITKPRPYPLFLLEKAAEFAETTATDLTTWASSFGVSVGGTSTSISSNGENGSSKNKEKVVILGTGWGGASFLKEIDTDLYDVTIISPRNFFVFTPMLAGASV